MASPELPEPHGLELRPFRGVRYTVDDISKITSPPYDVVSQGDVAKLLDAHPNNVVRLILPGPDRHSYGEARETLMEWLATGVLSCDEQPAIYVYEQVGPETRQRGLIADVALSAPERGTILPHEEVMPGPIIDRLALMRITEANLEPIFLLYEGGGPATALVERVAATRPPLVEAHTDDGFRHRLWAMTDAGEVDVVTTDLRERQAVIADGHHRYATYRALQQERRTAGHGAGPWDFGLALLVDSTAYPPTLKAIHRVIPSLPLRSAVNRAKGAWQVHEHADLEEGLRALAAAPEPAFLLAGAGACHLLTDPDPVQIEHAMPAERSPTWRSLNTSVLNEFLLPKVWGMHDDEQTVLIVHHDAHAAVAVARRTGGTAVLLNPLKPEDVMAVAAQGERVPRKSTSFGPKPRSGLVLRTFGPSPAAPG